MPRLYIFVKFLVLNNEFESVYIFLVISFLKHLWLLDLVAKRIYSLVLRYEDSTLEEKP